MIGKAYRMGTGFKGLAAYLVHGHRDGLQPDRVDWIETRNLPTRDPETAARLMAATARDSERVQKPVFHLSISFDPNDRVTPAMMRRVMDRTLRDLGLHEHQVLIIAHKDRQHPHVHAMVNRVHPERRTAWSNSWDYRRIEASLRAQEAELGLRIVPGKHAPVPEHARDRMERAPVQRVRGDAPFLERVRAEAGPHLTGARSWGELERGLGEHGLSLRVKGRGMVVTDGTREVKASEIDAAASRFRLERRLGSFTDYRARQAVAGRALDERSMERAAVERAAPVQQQRTPAPPGPERSAIPTGINREQRAPEAQRAPVTPPVDARTLPAPAERRARPRNVREAARDFSREARALYADPAAARRAFLAAAERRGADRAAAAFRDEPHRFGRLRPGADPARAERAVDAAFAYAREHAASDRAPLRQAAGFIREVDAFQRGERTVERLVEVAGKATRDAASLAQVRRDGLDAGKRFQADAGHVYADPAQAVRAVEAYRDRYGVEETARAIREAPDHFGPLRAVESTRYFGFQRVTSYEGARERAQGLAETFRAGARVPSARDVERAAHHAREAARTLDAARAALRPVNVQGHVREAASRLLSAQIGKGPEKAAQLAARLLPMVPTSAVQIVKQAMEIGKMMALGHDRERERERGLSR